MSTAMKKALESLQIGSVMEVGRLVPMIPNNLVLTLTEHEDGDLCEVYVFDAHYCEKYMGSLDVVVEGEEVTIGTIHYESVN